MNQSPHWFEVMSSVKELRGVPCLLASRGQLLGRWRDRHGDRRLTSEA